jgi:hypothetical protein
VYNAGRVWSGWARAFVELIERIPAKRLPKVGGTDATVVVKIDLDTLTGRIIPFVLGGKSQVLDIGRARRLFTKAHDPTYETTRHPTGKVSFRRHAG